MAFLRDEQIRDQKVKVVVFRGGRETVLYVMPAVIYREAVVYDPLWRYGLVIDDRYPDRVVILRVYPRTPAYYSGLRAGDVVVGLRGQRIARVADFVNAFTSADGRVALQVNRANRTRDLEIDASADADTRTSLKPQHRPRNADRWTRARGAIGEPARPAGRFAADRTPAAQRAGDSVAPRLAREAGNA